MSLCIQLLSLYIVCITILIEGRDPSINEGQHGKLKEASSWKAPYRSVGLVLMLYGDELHIPETAKPAKFWPASCSGTLISPIHVLTAAHCFVAEGVMNHAADLEELNAEFEIRFYYGFSSTIFTDLEEKKEAFSNEGWIDTNTNYKKVVEIQKCSKYTQWTFPNDEHRHISAKTQGHYDYAVMTLEEPLADKLILKMTHDKSLKVGTTLLTAGYPGEVGADKKKNRYNMYKNKFWIEFFREPDPNNPSQPLEEIPDIEEAQMIYDTSYEVSTGQSGSPIYKKVGKNIFVSDSYQIVGVLVEEVTGNTGAVRLNTESINTICDLMKASPANNDDWKKQKGCPGWDSAHASDINLLENEYNELLDEEIKTLRLLNKEKRRKNQHHQHHHF